MYRTAVAPRTHHRGTLCQDLTVATRVRQRLHGVPTLLSRHRLSKCQALGKEVMDATGWLDLSKLVTAGSTTTKTPYDELASKIGRDIYVDISGWHLFMRDMTASGSLKMSQALAMQLGPQAKNGLREADIEAVLKKVPVKLGAGKTKMSLYDVMPSMCIADLTKLIEEYARR